MSDLNIAMILRLVDRVSAPARKVRGALGGIADSATQAGNRATAFADRNVAALDAQRAAMRGSALETAAIGYGLYRAMQPAIEFESAMAGVRRVVTFDDETAIERLGDDILALTSSGGLPMAAEGVASIIEAAGQAGIIDDALPDDERRAQLIAFARDAAQMGVAFDMSAAQAGEAMAQWRGALGLTQERALGLGDAVNHISNSMNASAPDLVQVIRRQGAVAMTAGLAETEVAALSAAFLAGGASPEIAATALKNFTGALTRGEAMTARQRSVMEGLGFDATEMAERMQVDARGAITDVMTALSELPDARRGAALSQLFGEESMGAIAPLLNNLNLLRESFDLVADPSDFAGAMLEEYEQQASTTANAVARLRGFITALSTTFGSVLLPELNALLEGVMPVVGIFRDWVAENPELIRQIGIATAGLFAMRLASLALRFAALTAAVPVLRLIGAGGRLVAFLPVLGRALLALLNPFALVRGAMIALRVALLASGIGAIVAGIALAGLWIWNNWEGLLVFFRGFGVGLRAALGPAAPLLDWLVDRARALAEWVGALVAPLDASAEAWAEWGETAGSWLGGVVAQLIEWIEASPAVAKGVALVTAGVMGLRLALRVVALPLRLAGRLLGGVVGTLARLSGLRALRLSRLVRPLTWGAALIPRLTVALFRALATGGRRLLVVGLIRPLVWTAALIPRLASAAWVALAVGSRLAVSALVAPLTWTAALIPRLSPLRFRALAAGGARLAASALVTPLRWVSRLIPAIGWASLAGRLSWRSLITPLAWIGRGALRFIPVIGWAALAGELLWHLLIKPLGWDEYLSLDALSGYIEDIKEWFTWENLLEVISWVTWLPIAPFTALMERIFGFEWSDFLPDWSWSFIGRIDFGDLITWPEPPAWLLWLMGRDDSPIVEAPVAADMPGFDRLTPEVRQAAETVQAAAGRSALPAQRIAELREEAEVTRAEIAALEDQLTGPMGPGDMMASGLRRQLLGRAQAALQALVEQIAEAETQSDQLEAALALLSDTEAAPDVNITSIERALERVRELSGALRTLPGGTANGAAPTGTTSGEPRPVGARALGGSVRPGFGYRINEQGEEIFVPDVAGRVIPARAARMIMAASMAGVPAVAAAGAVDMPALASFNPATIAAEMPNIDHSPSLVGTGGGRQVGGVTVGDIHIHAAPGMSPQDIAAEVRREIERIGRESGAENGLHDGGQYDRD
ncbi:phage tail tape measure protein [Sediminimonas sp.]|uniref:phage tail tape measure protein n=1 Tax=Sediminimonas sp. TaxID=2823379 RepID=UPI0025E2B2F4|nr:phage tail tape measure protein [Sediminimonas sp.]